MDIRERIETSLHSLEPTVLQLVNESHQHGVPVGSQTHWNLLIVSKSFEGRALVERHRAVYAALGETLRSGVDAFGVHALKLTTLTPSQWEQSAAAAPEPSPPCRHAT